MFPLKRTPIFSANFYTRMEPSYDGTGYVPRDSEPGDMDRDAKDAFTERLDYASYGIVLETYWDVHGTFIFKMVELIGDFRSYKNWIN